MQTTPRDASPRMIPAWVALAAVVVYGGLVGAYTYSDMTGYALSNAGTPSG